MTTPSRFIPLLLALAAVLPAMSVDSCMANAMRDMADAINQQAYELDGKPQNFGQWWDSFLHGDDRSADRAQEIQDWWDHIW